MCHISSPSFPYLILYPILHASVLAVISWINYTLQWHSQHVALFTTMISIIHFTALLNIHTRIYLTYSFSPFLSLLLIHQVMLYVDGMNGVMKHSPTIQWLYTLIASKYRLVVKTALKLLLVFVEYCEGNCYLLVNAIRTMDNARGSLPWTNIMKWVSLSCAY